MAWAGAVVVRGVVVGGVVRGAVVFGLCTETITAVGAAVGWEGAVLLCPGVLLGEAGGQSSSSPLPQPEPPLLLLLLKLWLLLQ